MKIRNQRKNKLGLILILMIMLMPGMLQAQVNPGDIITSSLTLTGNLDASAYGGPALRVGANNIIIDGAGFTITVNGNNAGIELGSHSGVTITNVTVLGSTPGQGRGVYMANSGNSVISNNIFSGLLNAIYTGGTNTNNTFLNNDMSNSTGNAFDGHYASNNIDCVIKNNNITGSAGYAVNYYGRIAEISGNDFTGSNYGLSLNNGNYSASPLVLTWQGSVGPNTNTFGGHSYYPLSLNNVQFVNVSGWDISSLYTGTWTTKRGLVLTGVSDSHFENNILGGLLNAVYTSGTGARNTFLNNDMSNSTGNAFDGHYASNNIDCVIKNNNITGSAGYAVNYYGRIAEISGNDFTGSNYGLSLNNGNYSASPLVLTWQGSVGPNTNTFGGHSYYPLSLNNVQFVNVSGWDISSLYTGTWTTKRGLVLTAVSDSHFENNILSGLLNAVYTSGTGARNTFLNNDMSNSTGNAFDSNVHNCNNVNWTITANDMTGSGGYAMSYIGKPADISGNNFTGSGGGISFRGANNYTLMGNSNTWDLVGSAQAVTVDYTNGFTLSGLTVIGNGGTAVLVSYSNNVTIDGLETCGKNEGVYFRGGSGHTVQNSGFSGAAAGVTVYPGTSVAVTNNSFHNVGTDVSYNPTNTTVTISGSQTVSGASWCPTPNSAPLADAGLDQSVASTALFTTVTLDGSGTSDVDVTDVLTYSWTWTGGSATGVSPTISLEVGTYVITLTVDDQNGGTSTDIVNIVVVATPYVQTFTILGANGNVGDIDPYTQALPAGATVWQQAYLTGGHPWGLIPGTTSWVNFDPDNTVGINTRTPYRIRFMVPNDFTNPSMVFTVKADNRAIIWINDTYIDSVDGTATPNVPDQIVQQSLHAGLNEIRIMMVDWGGIVGLNYKIDVTMTSAEDITNAVLTPGEAVALNNPPLANAGPDQAITVASVTLDGSGSSDPDGNLLSYSWSENGTVIATGVNPTLTLADGTHTLTMTVSDGELSASDQVIVSIVTNTAPLADAGLDQAIDCVVGTAAVTLDGSGSSDADGDALTYSWSLGGTEVSTSASFTTSLSAGTNTYTLTVNDGQATSSDDVIVTVVADTEAPTITLSGANPANVNIHIAYTEAGYVTADACNSAVTVVVTGSVDVETPGAYTLTYTATDAAGNTSVAERIVNVINTVPVSVAGVDQGFDCVIGAQTVTLDGSGSSDADGDALTYSWSLGGTEVSTSASFTTSQAAGTLTYTLTVNDGFDTASDDVIVTVVADTEAPVITLQGDNPMSLGLYLAYTEPGFAVTDVCDANPVVVVSGSVDINIPGAYTVTYTATDASGNSSAVDRIVEVFNTAPAVANAISSFELSFGDDVLSAAIDLFPVFSDVDVNDVLSYSFSNSSSSTASVTLNGTTLTVEALDLGETVVEVTATDPWGASVVTSFTVTVNVTADLAEALLFAYTGIELEEEIEVNSGNILVNESFVSDDEDSEDQDNEDQENEDEENDDSEDENDHEEYELSIGEEVFIAPGYKLMANGIQVEEDASIESDVYSNLLENEGDISGQIFNSVSTPLFFTMPPFKSAPAGNQNITVDEDQSVVLQPGDYGRLKVKEGGSLTFSGGVYNIRKLEAKKYSYIRFETASEVRIEKGMKISKNSYVGPASGSFIDASDIIFYIAGTEDHVAKLGEEVEFYGTIYAPAGEVELKEEVSFTGAILSDEVEAGEECQFFMDSFFAGPGSGLAKGNRTAWVEPEMDMALPEVSSLAANYPNPFNPSTTIDFALERSGEISLKIYDIRGAEIAEIARGYYEAGHYSVHFTPENLSSGTYIYVLNAGSFREVNRMVYLK